MENLDCRTARRDVVDAESACAGPWAIRRAIELPGIAGPFNLAVTGLSVRALGVRKLSVQSAARRRRANMTIIAAAMQRASRSNALDARQESEALGGLAWPLRNRLRSSTHPHDRRSAKARAEIGGIQYMRSRIHTPRSRLSQVD